MGTRLDNWRKRAREQRAAAIPEYVLMVSAFIVGSLGAIQVLSDQGDEYINEQADCVKVIPGSSEAEVCGYDVTVPTTSATTGATTSTSPSTSTTTTTTTTPPTTTTTTTTPPTTSPPTTSPPPTTTTTTPGTLSVTISNVLIGHEGDDGFCPMSGGSSNVWCIRATFNFFVDGSPLNSGGNVSFRNTYENLTSTEGNDSCSDGGDGDNSCARTMRIIDCEWRSMVEVTSASASGYTWDGVQPSVIGYRPHGNPGWC